MEGQKYNVNTFTNLLKSLKSFNVYFNFFFRLVVDSEAPHILSVLHLPSTQMFPKYRTAGRNFIAKCPVCL